MPRFYFHLHNDMYTHDEEGREFRDVDAAHGAAVEDARQMAAESVRAGHLDLTHYVEVTDDSDRSLLRVTFGDVVTITNESDAEVGPA